MDQIKEQYNQFLLRFQNVKLINAVRLIEHKYQYIVFAVAVTTPGIIPAVDIANFNQVYPIFHINKFGEYKFVKLNIIDVVEESVHNYYWQIYYKY